MPISPHLQCPMSHTEGCLSRCYMVHFDNFLLKKHSPFPLLDHTSDLGPRDARSLASDVCKHLKEPDTKKRLYTVADHMGFDSPEYGTMIQEFFSGGLRPYLKRHYRDKLKYMELALILLQYLSLPCSL